MGADDYGDEPCGFYLFGQNGAKGLLNNNESGVWLDGPHWPSGIALTRHRELLSPVLSPAPTFSYKATFSQQRGDSQSVGDASGLRPAGVPRACNGSSTGT